MAKIDLEIVKQVLQHSDLGNALIHEILGELKSAIAKGKNSSDEEEKVPEKKQFVVVVSDAEGKLLGKEWVGWVLQLPESEAMQSVPEKLQKVAKSFNVSQRGRKHPVKTVGETCEWVSAKIFKEQKLWLKTKTPVLLVPMKNAFEEKPSLRSEVC